MKKILNFGSLNIDHVYNVPHFTAAGETLSSLAYNTFPGGKGLNQSIALARAGAKVYHAGRIGPDGAHLLRLMEDSGVDTTLVDQSGAHTGHAIIQVNSGGQNCILLYGGANEQITEAYIQQTLKQFGTGDLLVLQNEVNLLDRIIALAAEKRLLIALNPSPFNERIPLHLLSKVSWLLLNEVEGEQITGQTDPEQIICTLQDRFPDTKILLTLGKRGVVYCHGDIRLHHGIYDVPVVDTTAAGDTFTGYFLSCAIQELPSEECLRLASLASSLAVSQKGAATSIPMMEQVRACNLRPL